MDPEDQGSSRRKFLHVATATSLIGLAGCVGGGGEYSEGKAAASRPDDWCVEEHDVEVAPEERTAESIDGIERNPDDLLDRQEVAYQCYPQGYQLCANCAYYIPSKTKDDAGACALVAGKVRSRDWCARYKPSERLAERPAQQPLDDSESQVPVAADRE
jgi:hypothetical protein